MVLAAWYYRKGQITLQEAMDIAGMEKEPFIKFADLKREKIRWAEKARLLKKEREEKCPRYRGNFNKWVREHINMNPPYVKRLLKAEREFGGTDVEKLSLDRVLRLSYLTAAQKEQLKRGELVINGEKFTVDDLASMTLLKYRRLIKNPNAQIAPSAE